MEDLEQCSAALRKTLKQCCPPVHLSVLLRAYRMENEREVPYEQYGYSNAADFLREHFPELSLVASSSNRDYVVHLKNQTSPVAPNGGPRRNISTPTTPPVTTSAYSPRQPWTRAESGKTKTVPVKFRMFLARILEQYPFGISARDFVEVFYKTSGSALSYQLYGYPGHLSMFKDLPDVFRIEQISENEHKLFPLERSESRPTSVNDLRSRFENEHQNRGTSIGATKAWSQNDSETTPMKAPLSNSDPDLVRKYTTPMGTLITVSLDGNVLVPTGCLASMIGMSGDRILIGLKQQGFDVCGVKFLSNEIPEHSLLLEKLAAFRCPSLMSDDGRPVCVISLVPFKSCFFILRAFTEMPPRLQKQTEEIRSVIESLGVA